MHNSENIWCFQTELGYEEGSPDPELGDLTKLIGPHVNAEFIKKGTTFTAIIYDSQNVYQS